MGNDYFNNELLLDDLGKKKKIRKGFDWTMHDCMPRVTKYFEIRYSLRNAIVLQKFCCQIPQYKKILQKLFLYFILI